MIIVGEYMANFVVFFSCVVLNVVMVGLHIFAFLGCGGGASDSNS